MEPDEALAIAAQIAVALAGFAGVVVAFRSGPLHEWSFLDRYRLWLLLANALVPFFSCLFGMLLLTIKPTPPAIWHWGSAFSALSTLTFGLLSRRHQAHLTRALITEVGTYRYLFYTIAISGTAVGLLQVYNAMFPGVFWLFYLAIVFQLAMGALQFARMVLLPPHIGKP
jgi:hypothetical protein